MRVVCTRATSDAPGRVYVCVWIARERGRRGGAIHQESTDKEMHVTLTLGQVSSVSCAAAASEKPPARPTDDVANNNINSGGADTATTPVGGYVP